MDAQLAQHLMNWLVLGSIYTLVALGFSLLFGVLDVIHFSHGDVSIVAPFVVLATVQALISTVLPAGSIGALVLACAVAIAAVGLLGVLLDWLVIRRFRNAPAMMALVATVRTPAPDADSPEIERIIGVSRYITNPDRSSCEFSLVVADDFKGKGLGSRLMQSIMHFAREQGLAEIEGLVLARNAGMLKLMKELGFSIKPYADDPDFKWVTKAL